MSNSDKKPTTSAEERAKMLDTFIKKGGKVEKIPYGVTSQDLGVGHQNAYWMPPETISPKPYKTRLTKAKKKKAKVKKSTPKRKKAK